MTQMQLPQQHEPEQQAEGVQRTVPFFVADRPMSLQLLKGLPLQDYPGVRVGIMAHANTTANFQEAYRAYPCDNLDDCGAIGGPCRYRTDMSSCSVRAHILQHTVKMCDSGMFTREGAMLTYEELFKVYERMGVEYGIMIDVFLDAEATLASAREAVEAYKPFDGKFKLVAVAQGKSIEEYLDCFRQLKEMGFTYIAVGGLLRRRNNTARYPYVADESSMFDLLQKLRDLYPEDWLFALGCLHPDRLPGLKELNVWADYKGWIFQYKTRNQLLNSLFATLATNHLEHVDKELIADHLTALQRLVAERSEQTDQLERIRQQLYDGRRQLRTTLSALYDEVVEKSPDVALRFRSIITHGLLDDTEARLVAEVLRVCGKEKSDEVAAIVENITSNSELRQEEKRIQAQVEQFNPLLLERIEGLLTQLTQVADLRAQEETEYETGTAPTFAADIHAFCEKIVCIVNKTERENRFEQVHEATASSILAALT